MSTDRTVSLSVSKTLNPMVYSRSLPSGDRIKCIIKNNYNEELIFKDSLENWTPYIAKRVKNCDIRNSLCEDLRYYFPTLDLRTKHFVLKDVKSDNFNKHEYIFEMILIVDKYVLIRLPVNSFFTEFKWLNNNIVQNPVRLDDKETNMKKQKKLNIDPVPTEPIKPVQEIAEVKSTKPTQEVQEVKK